jgi:hypothetical protein
VACKVTAEHNRKLSEQVMSNAQVLLCNNHSLTRSMAKVAFISTELSQFFDSLDWPDPQHFKNMVLLAGKG